MLFIATHEHAPESCPSENPAQVHQVVNEEHIKASGVKLLGSYVAPPEHVLFFVLEADEYAQVVRYFQPIMKMGNIDIVPVQTVAEAMGIFPTG